MTTPVDFLPKSELSQTRRTLLVCFFISHHRDLVLDYTTYHVWETLQCWYVGAIDLITIKWLSSIVVHFAAIVLNT